MEQLRNHLWKYGSVLKLREESLVLKSWVLFLGFLQNGIVFDSFLDVVLF